MALKQNSNPRNFEEEYNKFTLRVNEARARVSGLYTDAIVEDPNAHDLYEELNETVEALSVAQEEMRQQNEELISSRYNVEEERHRYQELFEFAPDGYLVTNMDGGIQEANRAAAELLGADQIYLVGKPLAVFIESASRQGFRSHLTELMRQKGRAEWETRLLPRRREAFDALFTVSVSQDGQARWMIRDISEKKRTELQIAAQLAQIQQYSRELERERASLEIRVQERTTDLQIEIAERVKAQQRILALNDNLQRAMMETHHRVKNNLQMVSALIDIQSMDMTNDPRNMQSSLQRLTIHIRTLAALHDALTHQAKEDGRVDVVSARLVLERLLSLTKRTMDGMTLHSRFDDIELQTQQATALAIVANELISNAAKHGGKELWVTLRNEGERATLEVCDNGPGFPTDFRPDSDANIGLELVNSMTRHDLNGATRYANLPEGGAYVRVAFPLMHHAAEGAHPPDSFHPETGEGGV